MKYIIILFLIACNSKEQRYENIDSAYAAYRKDSGWHQPGVFIIDSVKLKEIQRSEYLSLGSEGFLLILGDTVFFFNRKTETPTSKIPKSFFCKSFSY